jgi:hypothetical protein
MFWAAWYKMKIYADFLKKKNVGRELEGLSMKLKNTRFGLLL